MASSRRFGGPPWCSQMSSYSPRVSPSAMASSAVGSVAASGMRALGRHPDRLEDPQTVAGAPDQLLDGVLGMRHQPEDVAGLVAHAGDVAQRSVEVLSGGVAEHDLAAGFHLGKRVLGCVVAPPGVLGGDAQGPAGCA